MKTVNYLSIFIGIIAIIISIYFYRQSKKEREPTFFINPLKIELIDSDRLQGTPITVKTNENEIVNSDVYIIKFYFFNKGKHAIKKDDILSDIFISSQNRNIKIVESRILKTSRDICNINISPDSTQKGLFVSFDILEFNDGFSGQIIYEGDTSTDFYCEGIIEGVEQFYSVDTYLQRRKLIDNIIIGILAIFFIGYIIILVIIQRKYKERLKRNYKLAIISSENRLIFLTKLTKLKVFITTSVLSLLIMAILFLSFQFANFNDYLPKSKESKIMEIIPTKILD